MLKGRPSPEPSFEEQYGTGGPFEAVEDPSESPADSPRESWCGFFAKKICKPAVASVGLVAANAIYFAPAIGSAIYAVIYKDPAMLGAGAAANLVWGWCLAVSPCAFNGGIAAWGFSDCCPDDCKVYYLDKNGKAYYQDKNGNTIYPDRDDEDEQTPRNADRVSINTPRFS